jgi:hypothetical protein
MRVDPLSRMSFLKSRWIVQNGRCCVCPCDDCAATCTLRAGKLACRE